MFYTICRCYFGRSFVFDFNRLVVNANLIYSYVQMARLNEGLSLFDAILIVPMFQIVWTFFSIFTGFIYFQEYQVHSSVIL